MEKTDIFFLHNLYEYNLRRERAMEFAEPSNLLLSLRSSILFSSALSFITGSQKAEEIEKLRTLVDGNMEKIDRLARKIRKSRSIKRNRTWYKISFKLYEEMKQAHERAQEIGNG